MFFQENDVFLIFLSKSYEAICKWIKSNLQQGGRKQEEMDLSFIDESHRQGVGNIAQICGLSLQEAYQLYRKHSYNIENAINAYLNPFSPQRVVRDIQKMPILSAQSSFSNEDREHEQAYLKYRHFVEGGIPFLKRYSLSIQNKIQLNRQSEKKSENNLSQLIKRLEQKFGCLTSMKIYEQTVDAGLIWSWTQKYPIGLFLLDEQKESFMKLKQILSDRNLSKNCSDFFHLIALEIGKQKVRPWLTKFFSTTADANNLIIMRVNYIDQVQVIAKIPLQQDIQKIQKQINRIKSQCIHRQLDETQIIKQHALNREGIRFKPQFFKQKMSKRQDARLRRAQNQAFFKAVIPVEKEKEDAEHTKKKVPSKTQISKQRQIKRKKLTIYSDGFILKIRLPSGRNLELIVGEKQQINYLFDYIDSLDGQIGFQKDYPRSFDIIYGPSNINSLLSKKSAKIPDILQNYQVLIVKEISDE